MIIHLKRFQAQRNGFIKANKLVQFPLNNCTFSEILVNANIQENQKERVEQNDDLEVEKIEFEAPKNYSLYAVLVTNFIFNFLFLSFFLNFLFHNFFFNLEPLWWNRWRTLQRFCKKSKQWKMVSF